MADKKPADSFECADCGQTTLFGFGRRAKNTDDEQVCETCDCDYADCSHCSARVKADQAQTMISLTFCIDCYRELFALCGHCNRAVLCSEMADTAGSGSVCESCLDNYYTYSEPMEVYILNSDAVAAGDSDDIATRDYAVNNWYSDENGIWYVDADNALDQNGSGLFDYGTNVLDHCSYDKAAIDNGALMFGVELEMEPADGLDRLDLIAALGGREGERFILKDDASLQDGVELVTIPLTLEGHRAEFGWEQRLAGALAVGKSGANTTACGIHVHINKRALSPLQIGRILVFLNSPALREQVTLIAQRESNSYCDRSVKKFTDGKRRSDSRFDIVNVGKQTVEIRMFRGNLRWQRVIKNIEFCHALVTYCADASLLTIEQWDVFAAWLLKRRGQYPELVKFLAEARAPKFTAVVRPHKDKQAEVSKCA